MVMAVKTIISNAQFEKILSNYNLGEFTSATSFGNGCVQTNLLVKTTKGKFAFRLYENRSREYISFEVNILNYFNKHNFPCAMPIRNIHGELISKFQNKYFSIFQYIEGNHIKKPTNSILPEIASKLAQLHNISKGYKPKYYEFRESHEPDFVRQTVKERSKKVKSKKECSYKSNLIEEELNKLKFPGSLPKGVNHCDYDRYGPEVRHFGSGSRLSAYSSEDRKSSSGLHPYKHCYFDKSIILPVKSAKREISYGVVL